MRTGIKFVGVLLVIVGAIWVLQGINVLPGSFMTGQMVWARNGAIAIAAGVGLVFASKRMNRSA